MRGGGLGVYGWQRSPKKTENAHNETTVYITLFAARSGEGKSCRKLHAAQGVRRLPMLFRTTTPHRHKARPVDIATAGRPCIP